MSWDRVAEKKKNLNLFLKAQYAFLDRYKKDFLDKGIELNPTVITPDVYKTIFDSVGRYPMLCYKLSLHDSLGGRKVLYIYFIAEKKGYNHFFSGLIYIIKDGEKLLCEKSVMSFEELMKFCFWYFKEDEEEK